MVRQYALGTTRAAARSMSITLAIVVAMLVNADGLIYNKAPSTSSDDFTTDTLSPATRTLATAAPNEAATDEALLDPEVDDAAAEEAEADDDAFVSLSELELVDVADDSVTVSAEAEVLVIVTSVSVLVLPTVVLLAESTEPMVALSSPDSALPAYELAMTMSLDALPASTVLLSNRVSPVEAALAALLVRRMSELSKLSSVFEAALELTALMDAEAMVDIELSVSCAQVALTARAQAMLNSSVECVLRVKWKNGGAGAAQGAFNQSTLTQTYPERAKHDRTSCGGEGGQIELNSRFYARTMPHGQQQHIMKSSVIITNKSSELHQVAISRPHMNNEALYESLIALRSDYWIPISIDNGWPAVHKL
ncbi:hypothetical protein PI124_g14306 [Phytophthora idaei]|nr:hypothetical protein PI124_g14306 [Phytophthora idaei]